MHRARLAAMGGVGAAVALVVIALLVTRPSQIVTPSRLPVSPTPTATMTATSTPAASPQATPSPPWAPQVVYMSKRLGFALELPPPWHKAICGDIDPVADETPAVQEIHEQFTSADAMEEFIGEIGSPNDRIGVALIENPQRRSMRDIAQSFSPSTPVSEVTFAGRPAAELINRGPAGDQLFYFVADGDRYYRVGYETSRPASAAPADLPTMQRIVRSYRFLSPAERQALPDPTPIPAGAATPQALAGLLRTAFDQRDAAVLERLLGPCVSQGFQQAGVGRVTRQKVVADLRTQLANGLVVMVDTSTVQSEPGIWSTWVRSRWNALPPNGLRPPPIPGQEVRTVELIMGRTTGGYYWRGTIVRRDPS